MKKVIIIKGDEKIEFPIKEHIQSNIYFYDSKIIESFNIELKNPDVDKIKIMKLLKEKNLKIEIENISGLIESINISSSDGRYFVTFPVIQTI